MSLENESDLRTSYKMCLEQNIFYDEKFSTFSKRIYHLPENLFLAISKC